MQLVFVIEHIANDWLMIGLTAVHAFHLKYLVEWVALLVYRRVLSRKSIERQLVDSAIYSY